MRLRPRTQRRVVDLTVSQYTGRAFGSRPEPGAARDEPPPIYPRFAPCACVTCREEAAP